MREKMNSISPLNLYGGRQHDEIPQYRDAGAMSFSSSDFQLMRWSIAAICSAILLSSAILYGSSKYAISVNKDQRIAQSKMNNARNQLAMAHEDQENLSDYSNQYDRLEKDNIIGDDHRLDWMESLENLRKQNLVINFRYNIAPQKIYAPQPAIDSGNFDIHYSETKLHLDLLHEGQLLNFFKALRSQGDGWYQLEGCTLKRIDVNEETAPAAGPRITAECSGGWITLKNRSTKP